jgi:long-chain acyl-CoA synthetase
VTAQAVSAPFGWLLERMQAWRDLPCIAWRERVVTYGDLLASISDWEERLDRQGLGAGQVVGLAGDFSPNSCAAMVALIEREAIVVPLTDAMRAHRDEFLATAEVEWLITFDASDAATLERRDVSAHHPLFEQLRAAHAPGLVIFTSGSTGKNKAAVHNFAHLLDKFKIPRRQMTTLTFLLFDHIGGINTLFQVLSNGGTVVTVQSRDPDDICGLIERHRVELLPPSPTFLNLLLISGAYQRHDLSSLKWITYGTEVMPESTLQRLREVFPQVRIKQAYGMSELGILRTQSRDDGSVWLRIGGGDTEIKVVDGLLWVHSPSAMLGYLNHPSPFDEDGWLNTGDAVDVDGEWMRVLGRRSELINVGGEKVFPAEVEGVLMQMDNIRDVTVYGERNPIMGNIVAARVNTLEPEDASTLSRRVRAFCRGKLASFKIPVRIVVGDGDLFSERYKKVRAIP